MDGVARVSENDSDPIMGLIEESGGPAAIDDFVSHMISLSDVVKNDMRKMLDWDDETVHAKLWALIGNGLDKNGRYRERPLETTGERHKRYSHLYVDTQCLLTEWIGIYRVLRAYCYLARKKSAKA